jgi:hypothetical protein
MHFDPSATSYCLEELISSSHKMRAYGEVSCGMLVTVCQNQCLHIAKDCSFKFGGFKYNDGLSGVCSVDIFLMQRFVLRNLVSYTSIPLLVIWL